MQRDKEKTLKASQILRKDGPKYEQIRNFYAIGGKDRCALGVLLSRFGWHPLIDDAHPYEMRVRKELGIKKPLWKEIGDLNDRGHTFNQIAEWLEKRDL